MFFIYKKHIQFFFFPLLCAIIFISTCARSFNPNVKRGSNFKFRKGYPEVRLSALSSWDEKNEIKLNITADIVYNSVFFVREGDKRKANLVIELQIKNLTAGSMVYANRFSHDQIVENKSIVNSQKVFTYQRTFDIDSGKHEITFTLIDQHTGRRTTRKTEIIAPNVLSDSSIFSSVKLYAKEKGHRNSEWFPITTYDLPGKLDSLKFTYQVSNKSQKDLSIESSLIKLKADTTAAEPMHVNNYSPSSIQFKGIDYSERTIIQTNKRTLPTQSNITIEVKLPMMQRGNYRFEVINTDDSSINLYKARDFSVKSENYPTVKSALELARPLIYIMNRKEYSSLMEIKDAKLLKLAVDKFWLKNIGDRSDAKTVISLFYSRVEEANKLFSNFKEGWKTDRGMIYVLFGEPWHVEEIRNTLKWSYAYDRTNHDFNYLFNQIRNQSEYFPFEHFTLKRNFSLYQMQYKQIELWRSGYILVRKL